ncbi:uncharacterized protein LOC129972067 [Argiope bruennichi]|uniref:uncharacterized protein LOC129972067 n=1 Tax=Argiope bruennichi TaxID=94029 RepID=UPI00249509CF|nr:uncharacterized protein LOC129972067 [Argiope bruennichi]
MGAQMKPPPGIGSYCYRIHSKIYHMVSPLYSGHNKPGYGQLYVFDSSEANEKRMERNEGCLFSVMERLDFMLTAINPFIDCYLQMHRIIEENHAANIRMVFRETRNLDIRRYKQHITKTEIAAIFAGDNGVPPVNRDICIYPVGNSSNGKNISPLNQCCDPIVYPLLFPRGELGCLPVTSTLNQASQSSSGWSADFLIRAIFLICPYKAFVPNHRDIESDHCK